LQSDTDLKFLIQRMLITVAAAQAK